MGYLFTLLILLLILTNVWQFLFQLLVRRNLKFKHEESIEKYKATLNDIVQRLKIEEAQNEILLDRIRLGEYVHGKN